LSDRRTAVARIQVVIAVVVILVAAAAAGLFFLNSGQTQAGPALISMTIMETDPVNQVDSLNPSNVTAVHGTTITLAVYDGDDAARTVVISAFNVNQTISSGTTQRMTFVVGQPGVYQIFVPARPAENGLKSSPSITGYLIVT